MHSHRHVIETNNTTNQHENEGTTRTQVMYRTPNKTSRWCHLTRLLIVPIRRGRSLTPDILIRARTGAHAVRRHSVGLGYDHSQPLWRQAARIPLPADVGLTQRSTMRYKPRAAVNQNEFNVGSVAIVAPNVADDWLLCAGAQFDGHGPTARFSSRTSRGWRGYCRSDASRTGACPPWQHAPAGSTAG